MSKRSEWIETNQTKDGIKLGMIAPAVFLDYVRYTEFLSNINQGMERGKAIQKTAKYLNVHRTTIIRAISFYEDCA